MNIHNAAKWLAQRAFTLWLYQLAIIGGASWDRHPNSWPWIALHLTSAAAFLWWAVNRTIAHREDQ